MSKDNENHSHAQLLEFRTETPRIPLKYSEDEEFDCSLKDFIEREEKERKERV